MVEGFEFQPEPAELLPLEATVGGGAWVGGGGEGAWEGVGGGAAL